MRTRCSRTAQGYGRRPVSAHFALTSMKPLSCRTIVSLFYLYPKLWSRINATALIPENTPCATRCCHAVQVFDLSAPLAFKAEAVVDKDWVKTVQVTNALLWAAWCLTRPPQKDVDACNCDRGSTIPPPKRYHTDGDSSTEGLQYCA